MKVFYKEYHQIYYIYWFLCDFLIFLLKKVPFPFFISGCCRAYKRRGHKGGDGMEKMEILSSTTPHFPQ
ncbi:MAG TPA: hypothetical protein DSN98_04890 [Thermoplasmata archaeon]|nr:MAG TPA: hypothetical protein DSN98_04890 [Thermoplasmata archaeon]